MKRSLILPGILIAITLWGLLSLGFWQLNRAAEKRVIEQTVIVAQSRPAELITKADELLKKPYYRVLLQGYYDGQKQFIYDNQIVNSNAGYYVLTPFVLNDKTAILVNRGFVPWYGKRNQLADIKVSGQPATIAVSLIQPKQRIQLKPDVAVKTFPMLIQALDLDALSQHTDYQFVPIIARLDMAADNGFYRKWQPFYGSVDKHLGYALQWFLMALVLFLIAVHLGLKHSRKYP